MKQLLSVAFRVCDEFIYFPKLDLSEANVLDVGDKQQLINHLYETGHETYRIPRNNAK